LRLKGKESRRGNLMAVHSNQNWLQDLDLVIIVLKACLVNTCKKRLRLLEKMQSKFHKSQVGKLRRN